MMQGNTGMTLKRAMIACLPVLLSASSAAGALALVEDGRSRAQIVISEDPPRRTKMAAEELQTYLERISGARLPIGVEPDEEYPVTIYVGRSEHTEEIGVDDDGLEHGAFRIVSGPDWLVLLGHDEDFEPAGPWGRKARDSARQEQWEKLAGGQWINPLRNLWRDKHREDRGGLGWGHDSGGSFHAVGEFLHKLGVRWYMPGELGTVIPEMESIELPDIDRTFTPDYPLRYWAGAFFAYQAEDVMWEMRLRMNQGYDVLGGSMNVHGMRLIHGHEALQEEHPEYFALHDGERDTETRGTGHACFSSEGLVREAVGFARATFDIYDEPAVDVWPQDGLRRCECELCKGKSNSDLVWGFIDRVAREVYETHPDRLITGGAYAQYQSPPESIERFSPNVAVFICNVGRPTLDDEERWAAYWDLVSEWKARLAPGRIIRNENNRYSGGRPVPFGIIHPRAMARDLSRMKGISMGDWNEQARSNFGKPGKTFWNAPGLDHLTLYVNARFLWDADQDLDALLEEYYRLFYGPAAAETRAAFEFAESTYSRHDFRQPRAGRVDIEDRLRFVEKMHKARDAAGEGIYGERIDLILSELQPLEDLRRDVESARKREGMPVYTGLLNMGGRKWGDAGETLELDGKIEEEFWTAWAGGVESLRVSKTGEAPTHQTRFRLRYYRGDIYLAVRCYDNMEEPLNISTTEDQDPAIFEGDHVELLLETSYHSYYRLVVNPAGALLDMDMGAEEGERGRWASNASVAVHRGEEYWSVEMRIRRVGETEGAMDPYHYVVGAAPSGHRSRTRPWHFNVGRVRIRDDEAEISAFSPTGDRNLQNRDKFAEMYSRN